MLDNDIIKEKRFTSSVCGPKTATSGFRRHFPECGIKVDVICVLAAVVGKKNTQLFVQCKK